MHEGKKKEKGNTEVIEKQGERDSFLFMHGPYKETPTG